MEEGGFSSGFEIGILVAFFIFVGFVGHFRLKLDHALTVLPAHLRDYLGLEGKGGSPRRRRRLLADRLTIYGLPDWVPLSEDGRAALRMLRLLMLGFLMALVLGPALSTRSLWGMLALPVVLAVVGVRAFRAGRWPDPPNDAIVTRDGP